MDLKLEDFSSAEIPDKLTRTHKGIRSERLPVVNKSPPIKTKIISQGNHMVESEIVGWSGTMLNFLKLV
jgi:hypothetical protein